MNARPFMLAFVVPPLALFALGLSGCAASLRAATSGKIGCPEEEIAITRTSAGLGPATWTAECRGRRFFCGATATLSCTPELGAPR
jgi:hypothetical protein